MAAVTVSRIDRVSMGSKTLHIVNISSATNGDTYAPGLSTAAIAAWAVNATSSAGSSNDVAFRRSGDSYVFGLSGTATALQLFIVSDS